MKKIYLKNIEILDGTQAKNVFNGVYKIKVGNKGFAFHQNEKGKSLFEAFVVISKETGLPLEEVKKVFFGEKQSKTSTSESGSDDSCESSSRPSEDLENSGKSSNEDNQEASKSNQDLSGLPQSEKSISGGTNLGVEESDKSTNQEKEKEEMPNSPDLASDKTASNSQSSSQDKADDKSGLDKTNNLDCGGIAGAGNRCYNGGGKKSSSSINHTNLSTTCKSSCENSNGVENANSQQSLNGNNEKTSSAGIVETNNSIAGNNGVDGQNKESDKLVGLKPDDNFSFSKNLVKKEIKFLEKEKKEVKSHKNGTSDTSLFSNNKEKVLLDLQQDFGKLNYKKYFIKKNNPETIHRIKEFDKEKFNKIYIFYLDNSPSMTDYIEYIEGIISELSKENEVIVLTGPNGFVNEVRFCQNKKLKDKIENMINQQYYSEFYQTYYYGKVKIHLVLDEIFTGNEEIVILGDDDGIHTYNEIKYSWTWLHIGGRIYYYGNGENNKNLKDRKIKKIEIKEMKDLKYFIF